MFADVTHVVLSGGGVRGFCYVGALVALGNVLAADGSSYGEFCRRLQMCAGTSIGCLFALLLSLELPPEAVDGIRAPDGTVSPDFLPRPGSASVSELGIDRGAGLVRMAELLLSRRHFGADVTLGELRRFTGKRLVCCATDVLRMEAVLLDADTAPDMRVVDAVAASMRVPLVYAPHVDVAGRRVLADGCLVNNFPLAALPAGLAAERVLGLRTEAASHTAPVAFDAALSHPRLYLSRATMCPLLALDRALLAMQPAEVRRRVVTFPTGSVVGVEFDADAAVCRALWWSGALGVYRAAGRAQLGWALLALGVVLRACVASRATRLRREAATTILRRCDRRREKNIPQSGQ